MRILPLTLGVTLAAAAAFAQTLAPGRDPVDNAAIDSAWTEARDQILHSGGSIPFTPPSELTIPDNELGNMIREGRNIFLYTPVYAGEYLGNDMACTNCHLDGGRRFGAAPMWGAYPVYPKYRSKNKQVNTIQMRLQGCFRYSMNGTAPAADSEVMNALVAYLAWMSSGAPIGANLAGAGFVSLDEPPEQPSIDRGAEVYVAYCAACHQARGEGLRRTDAAGWTFPPLWGPESYNWGAGMHEPDKAAAFIKRNMPFGRQNLLTDQQAWDVSYYLNSHERPQDPRFTGDIMQTREKFHAGKHNLYGTTVNGVLIGTGSPPG